MPEREAPLLGFGLRCPACRDETWVIDSRHHPNGIRRRRRCSKCEERFTTYEVDARTLALLHQSGEAADELLSALTRAAELAEKRA